MERNFRKRTGRFIKSTDNILNVVSLKEFSFESIRDTKIVQPDNPNGTLIYARYHENEELKKSIIKHRGMDSEVRDVDAIPPILQPIDFTKDWRRQQERVSKRGRHRNDDDDEYELELELATIRQQLGHQEEEAPPPDDGKPLEKPDLSKLITVTKKDAATGETHVAQLADLEVTEKQRSKQIFDAQADGLDSVGKVITEVAKASPEEASHAALHIKKAEDIAAHEPAVQKAVIPPEKQSSFEVFSPELEAMKEYQEVLANPELTPDKLREAIDESLATGYKDGFQQGEEKATIQLQNVTKNVVENVEGILAELSSLRRGILEGAEKNFAEVCQALSEALLGHELSINPQAFSDLVSKIARESISDDAFKVAIHPDFHAQLKRMNITALEGKIIEDPELKNGDFRIESQQAVIDGNLKQMIADLLAKADLKLFTETDKAS